MTNSSTAVCLLGMLTTLAAGCASKVAHEEFQPGSGVAEYREIVDRSTRAIQKVLTSLESVATQSNGSSPSILTGFSADVQRLQVDSIQVRARSQAILTRGDDYFERWHETMTRVRDPEMRALAEQRRPALAENFARIKQASQEARAAFDPFLSGLRGLRNSLEADPASLRLGPNQDLLVSTRSSGRQLLECLGRIRTELDSMKSLLTPFGAASKN